MTVNHYNVSSRYALAAGAAACIFSINTAIADSPAEINTLKNEVIADLDKALEANIFGAAWYVGWATGKSAKELAWVGVHLQKENRARDFNFGDPVNLPFIDPILGNNRELSGIFGVPMISQDLEFAINDAMATEAQMTHAISSFMLSDARLLGAVDAGEFAVAKEHLAEMELYLNEVNSIVDETVASWEIFGNTLVAEGLTVDFEASDNAAFLVDLAANGTDAFPMGFEDRLHDIGLTDARIAGEFIPDLLGTTVEGGGFIGSILTNINADLAMPGALAGILAEDAGSIPAPGSLALLGMAGLVGTRRRRR